MGRREERREGGREVTIGAQRGREREGNRVI